MSRPHNFFFPLCLTESALARVSDVQEPILIGVVRIDLCHELVVGCDLPVDKCENGLVGAELDPLADHVLKVLHRQVLRHKVLFLVNVRNVIARGLLANARHAVRVALADTVALLLPLL